MDDYFLKIYCAAALMLAFKIREYDHYRMKPIIMSYFHCAPRKEFGKIMNDQVYSNIKNKVWKFEIEHNVAFKDNQQTPTINYS